MTIGATTRNARLSGHWYPLPAIQGSAFGAAKGVTILSEPIEDRELQQRVLDQPVLACQAGQSARI
jgi:hypothetical protein